MIAWIEVNILDMLAFLFLATLLLGIYELRFMEYNIKNCILF